MKNFTRDQRTDPYLDGFHGWEGNISEEFGRGGSCQIEWCTVQVGIFFSNQVTVHDLEYFVETELADALHGVPYAGRSPTTGKSTDSFFSNGYLVKRKMLHTHTQKKKICWDKKRELKDECNRYTPNAGSSILFREAKEILFRTGSRLQLMAIWNHTSG